MYSLRSDNPAWALFLHHSHDAQETQTTRQLMTLEKCLSFFFPDNKLLRFTTKINYASKPGSLSSKSFSSLCISAPSNTKSCKKPTPPPNAHLRLASQALREWFSNGERVYYQCNPGYSQTGFSIQRCSKGQWMPAKSLLTCIG